MGNWRYEHHPEINGVIYQGLQLCPPQKKCGNKAATDGTKPNLNISETTIWRVVSGPNLQPCVAEKNWENTCMFFLGWCGRVGRMTDHDMSGFLCFLVVPFRVENMVEIGEAKIWPSCCLR